MLEFSYTYAILFDSAEQENKPGNFYAEYHRDDAHLQKLYPVIWYIMHLPRNVYDFLPVHDRTECVERSNAHDIIFIPASCLDQEEFQGQEVTLLFAEASCREAARVFLARNAVEFGVCGFEELGNDSLRNHWRMLYQASQAEETGLALSIPFDTLRVFPENQRLGLTLFYLNSWFQNLGAFYETVDEDLADYYNQYFKLRCRFDTCRYVSANSIADKTESDSSLGKLMPYVEIPVTLTLDFDNISEHRDAANHMMGVHHAISHNGVLIEKKADMSPLFSALKDIENSAIQSLEKNGTWPKAKFLWKRLESMGQFLFQLFTEDELAVLRRSSHIVAFTDFPIGLAILPGHSAPLCCYKEIAYRHLEPQTSAIIAEMEGHIMQEMSDGLNVLMIECIPPEDKTRSASDQCLKFPLEALSKRDGAFRFSYQEACDKASFFRAIYEMSDIDILLISAHGFYEESTSGIYAGNDKIFTMNRAFRSLPKAVIFSACHVSPRGSNAVMSIVEEMSRQANLAVLGTNIPVRVNRNAKLILRFLLSILSTQRGENPHLYTLLDVWRHIVSSNAVYEVVESNSNLRKWFRDKLKGAKKTRDVYEFMEVRFQLRANERGLRYTDAYEDTFDLLISLARDDRQYRIASNLENVRYQRSVFPESLFYEWYGFPENIVVDQRNQPLKVMREHIETFRP